MTITTVVESIPAQTVPSMPAQSPDWETRVAPVLFGVAFAFLVLMGGFIHRASQPEVTAIELNVMAILLAVLWPVFLVDAGIAYLRRSPTVPLIKVLFRIALVVLIPPMRLAWVHPVTNQICLPRMGWVSPGKAVLKRLDRAFGGPMLIFAFLILPVLGIEYFKMEETLKHPTMALALHIATALIWVAFAAEFAIKVSVAPSSLMYMKERWVDLAIVLLPTLEFILTHWVEAAPIARLLRLGRAIGPQQIGQLGKAYRLRGLMMKAWQALMLLEAVSRLLGNTPTKRLQKIEAQIADLEEQLLELHNEAVALRERLEPPITAPDRRYDRG